MWLIPDFLPPAPFPLMNPIGFRHYSRVSLPAVCRKLLIDRDSKNSWPDQLRAGAARGIRTPDPVITNDVLYQLSYCGEPKRLNACT